MSVRLLLPLAVLAAAGGFAAGWFGHALWQRDALPEPGRRSPGLRAVMRDYERGGGKDVTREDAARLGEEALLLWAVANEDDAELKRLLAGANSAAVRARAAEELGQRAFPKFLDWLDHFHANHPSSWMLQRVKPVFSGDERR